MTTTFSVPSPRTNGKGYLPGMNTQFHLDYGREFAFNNLMKQARDVWVRNINDTFDGTLDSNGYITDPGTAVTYNQVVVIAASSAGILPLGNYVLTWSGTGDCELVTTGTMSIGSPTTSTNRKVYNITDWGDDDVLYFRVPIASTDVTDVVICHEDYEGTCGPGDANEFYQPFVDLYSEFTGGIRFMNWLATNQQEGWTDWADRKPDSYRTYTHGAFDRGAGRHAQPGIPLSACVRMQNLLGVPGWYNIRAEYDDASVEAFGQYLVDNVDPELLVAIEYSNETWNGMFAAEDYAQEQGLLEVANTRYITLASMADTNFNGDYFQSNNGEVASGSFSTVNAAFNVFKRENGGTTYVLYHNQTSGNWEVATSNSDPDTWTNSQSVTLGTPETVCAGDTAWTENSTTGPDEGDANVTATSRFSDQNETYPKWPWAAYRSTQCKRIIEPLFNAAGQGDRVCFVLGLQVGSTESKNALDCHVEVNFGVDAHEKPEDHHDSATIAFYWGNALLAEPQYSNNGLADDAPSSLRDGATKNTVNMSKEEVYQFFESLDAYESTLAGSTRWADWENRIVTTGGMEMLGYEGQHHVVCVGGVAGEAPAQTIVGYYEEERWGDVTLTMLCSALDNGFGTLMHFIALENTDPDGYWGLAPTYADWDDIETYQRLRAVKHFAGQTNKREI
jgi:hypothetical protein